MLLLCLQYRATLSHGHLAPAVQTDLQEINKGKVGF